MRRRSVLVVPLVLDPMLSLAPATALADASHAQLASYYDRHAAVLDGTVFGWDGRGAPRRLRNGITQVAVSRDLTEVGPPTMVAGLGVSSVRTPSISTSTLGAAGLASTCRRAWRAGAPVMRRSSSRLSIMVCCA